MTRSDLTTLYDLSYLEHIAKEEGPFAIRLAQYLKGILCGVTVVDLGCGPGIYATALRNEGVHCIGVDSSPALPATVGFKNLDLLSFHYQEWARTIGAGFCLCLEVFEHIPEVYADLAMERICDTAPWILFSAAHPGQGGVGHINCQPKAYWLQKFCKQGFYYCPDETDAIVSFVRDGYHMDWAVSNFMILRKV